MNTAMILAAGRGERLRPITDLTPKALCRVHNIPLIEYHVINLAKAGFKHIVVNHAYLGGQIRQYLGSGKKWGVTIEYSQEPPGGLETGGGIVNALNLIGSNPFITVNADIFIEYDFNTLQMPPHKLLHLVLVKKPDYFDLGDFGLDSCQLLNNKKELTFTGVASYHPEIFKNNKPGRYSVVPLLRNLIEKHQGSGELYTGKWSDIGTPERLNLANIE